MRLMKLVTFCLFAAAAAASNVTQAQIPVIAGSFQGWVAETGVVMTEGDSGIFQATITGLTAGDFHEFKILSADALPADWGDPQWTATNNWFKVDPMGSVTIKLDTNIGMTGENNQNVGTSSSNWTPQLVGNFMDEAGGSADWVNPDPLFDMNYVGGTLWFKTINVSNPGSYLCKLVTEGLWNRQFNVRGYADLFAEDFSFETTLPNQEVVFFFDAFTPSLTIVPQVATSPSLVNARPYHNSFPGSDKVDGGVSLIQRGATEQQATLGNIISSSQGINGVVLDFDNLAALEDISLEYKWSQQNIVTQPVNDWDTAPAPTASLLPDAGQAGSDRVLLTWPNNSILNRYLCIKVIYDGIAIAELYLGHLKGEQTGGNGTVFSVSYAADLQPIRLAVGTAPGADGRPDVDKSGQVQLADIVAMRTNAAAQLTQVTIPAVP